MKSLAELKSSCITSAVESQLSIGNGCMADARSVHVSAVPDAVHGESGVLPVSAFTLTACSGVDMLTSKSADRRSGHQSDRRVQPNSNAMASTGVGFNGAK